MQPTPLDLHPDTLVPPQAIPAALPFDRPWLAPLAGYTDLPFRLLCREYGAAVCCTEMVSAKGLVYHSPGTRDLLLTLPEDQPAVVQLFGCEPDILRQAMEPLLERGFRWFDLNMGCSVPKVTRTGCGAAMLKDIPNALTVARAMIDMAGAGRVGFKIRLGWDAQQEVWLQLAQGLQDAGAGWVTLHPRYAKQGFGGEARWSALRTLAEKMDIPVIASGDLFTAEDGIRCLRETGVSTVMYARGAMQWPGIFAEHTRLWDAAQKADTQESASNAGHTTEGGHTEKRTDSSAGHSTQTDSESACPAQTNMAGTRPTQAAARAAIRDMIRRHAALASAYSNERVALFKMRTFVPRYVHDLPGVRLLRQGLSACMDWDTLNALLDSFLLHPDEH